MGEPLGAGATSRKICGGILCGGGGGGDEPSNSNSPITTNTDRRMALQDGVVLGDGATAGSISRYDSTTSNDNSVTYAADAMVLQTLAETMPDAVRAMTNAGADVISRAGGAVVNLNRDSINANSQSFDSVVNFGARAIDRIIDASVSTTKVGNSLAAQAVASFQPAEKNNADTMKYAMFAAAGLVAVVLLKGAK